MSTVTNASAAIGLLLQLLDSAARVSTVIRQAQSEGRDVSDEELASIANTADADRDALAADAAAAKAAGN